MEPFYFGSHDRQLFGVYYSPKKLVSHREGILICPPIAQEYMRTHIAIRQLSKELAKAGYHVLKFDYLGIGDSAGGEHEWSIEQWKEDIQIAYDELKDMSGLSSITIVGLRFGAALAIDVSKNISFKNIVLWDPVLNGKQYLNDLRFIKNSKTNIADTKFEEIIGFLFSNELISSIEKMNFIGMDQMSTKLHLFVSQQKDLYTEFFETLRNDNEIIYKFIDEPANWSNPYKYDQALISNRIIKSISETLSQ